MAPVEESCEAMERLFARFGPEIREVLNTQANAEATTLPDEESKTPDAAVPDTSSVENASDQSSKETKTTARQQARQAKQQERQERYRLVHDLHKQGLSIRQIAHQSGLSKQVVIRYLREEECPDWKRSVRHQRNSMNSRPS